MTLKLLMLAFLLLLTSLQMLTSYWQPATDVLLLLSLCFVGALAFRTQASFFLGASPAAIMLFLDVVILLAVVAVNAVADVLAVTGMSTVTCVIAVGWFYSCWKWIGRLANENSLKFKIGNNLVLLVTTEGQMRKRTAIGRRKKYNLWQLLYCNIQKCRPSIICDNFYV